MTWVGKRAVLMAALAALSLVVTVGVASHALNGAANIVLLGDGEALVNDVVVDLWEMPWPLTSEKLAPLLAKHRPQRLRYLALADRDDRHVVAQAGEPAVTKPLRLPGEIVRQGRRMRLMEVIPPPWETRAEMAPGASGAAGGSGAGHPPLPARPYLVVEFDHPIIEQLQRDLMQLSVVAGVAALVLMGFAFAWSRTTSRLAEVERRAERERRLVALGRASSVMAHELRNPLAALKGHAQLLLEELVEPSRSKAERVVEGAERLERLTNVLLDFVRDGPLDVHPVSPSDLIDHALVDFPRDRFRIDLSRAPEVLHVDVERTTLALRNLLQNANQATEAVKERDILPVEVRVEQGATEVVIEVRDHGAGLARGQIFDPFVTTKVRGVGLGLSIAQRIAEQHRGTLTGENHSEGGAVLRLVLPLTPRAEGSA
jgi:two-component system sensor histidine kinase HydH